MEATSLKTKRILPDTEVIQPVFKVFDKCVYKNSLDKIIEFNFQLFQDIFLENSFYDFKHSIQDLPFLKGILRKEDIIFYGKNNLKDYKNILFIYLGTNSNNSNLRENLNMFTIVAIIRLDSNIDEFIQNDELNKYFNLKNILKETIPNSVKNMRNNQNFKFYQKGIDGRMYQVLEK